MATEFGAASTTDEVLEGVDLGGKRVLVTGASAGLGVETLRSLAAHGAEVVGTARDLAKAGRATAGIPADAIDLRTLDLASLDSVRACADALNADGRPFDIVIANAGVMACPQGRTADGFEAQFGTNHLGHFLLLNRIAGLLPSGGRVVCVSSSAHRLSGVDLDDVNFDHTPYDPLIAYARSKTANMLFALEFDRRHRERGVRAAAVHPGLIQTELARYMTPEVIADIAAIQPGGVPPPPNAYKTIEQGAATSVWAGAVARAEEVGGHYCEDCRVAEINPDVGPGPGVRPHAVDAGMARALWAKSEELIGEHF